ncbi:hypothetical protein NLG97_g6915 [Lecanicillium saksenae]|uniref:Uncharacterized protein n=1 Tax=Lecanicillium saksenae TaxID=468837 RepID=A0ACC1QNU9_9HYPO|nr:hypothetical protein NLG97_g6915 [Lecanicillium saksenae]
MALPTIVLVHGFWGDAAHWTGVIPILHKLGYPIRAVELPLTSLAADSLRTQQIANLVDGPVILVGHSYGGAVITEAGGALGPSKVSALVYIAAFAPDVGESPGGISTQYPAFAAVNNRLSPDADGFLWLNIDTFAETFAQDADPELALVMAVTQKAPLASTFGENITKAGWKSIPSWYQISTDDRCINPEAQKWMSGRLNAKKVIELPTGHASLASQPKPVADLIVEAAKAVSK